MDVEAERAKPPRIIDDVRADLETAKKAPAAQHELYANAQGNNPDKFRTDIRRAAAVRGPEAELRKHS